MCVFPFKFSTVEMFLYVMIHMIGYAPNDIYSVLLCIIYILFHYNYSAAADMFLNKTMNTIEVSKPEYLVIESERLMKKTHKNWTPFLYNGRYVSILCYVYYNL